MTYPVPFRGQLIGPSDYEVDGIPHFVFIDANGQVVDRYQGLQRTDGRCWEDDFQKALKSSH